MCVYVYVYISVNTISCNHTDPSHLRDNIIQFKCPSSLIIAGPSQCGKTTFTRQLLREANVLFERPIKKIVYCYGQWQGCLKDMTGHVQFVEGIPEDIPSMSSGRSRLRWSYAPLQRWWTHFGSLYKSLSPLWCDLHLLDTPGKFSRSISLNAHYIIAFNNPRDTLGLRTLAQQVPFVWESFQDATSQPSGYLMLDLHPRTHYTQRVRARILPTEHRFPIVYVNKEMHRTDEPLPVLLS